MLALLVSDFLVIFKLCTWDFRVWWPTNSAVRAVYTVAIRVFISCVYFQCTSMCLVTLSTELKMLEQLHAEAAEAAREIVTDIFRLSLLLLLLLLNSKPCRRGVLCCWCCMQPQLLKLAPLKQAH